jgi:hypothetical protein
VLGQSYLSLPLELQLYSSCTLLASTFSFFFFPFFSFFFLTLLLHNTPLRRFMQMHYSSSRTSYCLLCLSFHYFLFFFCFLFIFFLFLFYFNNRILTDKPITVYRTLKTTPPNSYRRINRTFFFNDAFHFKSTVKSTLVYLASA